MLCPRVSATPDWRKRLDERGLERFGVWRRSAMRTDYAGEGLEGLLKELGNLKGLGMEGNAVVAERQE